MSVLRLTFALGAALLASVANAGARADLTSFTRDLNGLDGTFVQKVYDARGKLKETSSGRVALSTPRLFRWEYRTPHPQLIVADGKKVWVFDPDLEQATVRPQGPDEQNSPLAALLDPAKLEARFVVKEEPTSGGLSWLQLGPRGTDPAFQSARMGFSSDGLERLQVTDALGHRTDIAFSGWKRNPAFGKSVFRYVPGKGVDVIGER